MTTAPAPTPAGIAAFLDGALGPPAHGEPPTLFRPSGREVRRLGLALEPGDVDAESVAADGIDALLLHRPWGVESIGLPDDVGILACHGPFDRRMAPGVNPEIEAALGLSRSRPLHQGRALVGRVADFAGGTFAALLASVEQTFGGYEEAFPGARDDVPRVAVAEAMTDALIREVDSRGGFAYLTGQFRQPARQAVRDTGMAVIAIGHRRTEAWALARLAAMLGRRFAPGLHVVPLSHPRPERAR